MPTKLPYDRLNDFDPIDPSANAKDWDRRRRGESEVYAIAILEHAATYLIEDQMSETRTYWPGAVDAVHLLRERIGAIQADEVANQRVGRSSASWLPKHVLARLQRDGISDA